MIVFFFLTLQVFDLPLDVFVVRAEVTDLFGDLSHVFLLVLFDDLFFFFLL